MSDFKDKIRFLRDEFSQEDRRGGFDEFGTMKKQLIQEFFNDDPFFMTSTRVQRFAEKPLNAGPMNNSKQEERVVKLETQKDKQNVSKGSLENLYEKIRDLKSEFQHVEEKMRSAVESLPAKQSSTPSSPGPEHHSKHGDQDWDTRSSRSWRRKDDSDDRTVRSSKSDYYPGKFTEKLKSRSPEIIDIVNGLEDSVSSTYGELRNDSASRVSSPTYPFLSTKGSSVSSPASSLRTPPARGSTALNLPFPEYGTAKSPTSDYMSGVSTPMYPFARSSCVSPESGCSPSSSEHTITVRPVSPHLVHSETYIQIPVQKDRSSKVVEVGRYPLQSWELTWQKIRAKPSDYDKYCREVLEEKFGYEATVFEYLDM